MTVWWCSVEGRREQPQWCQSRSNPDHDYCRWWTDREVSLKEIEKVLARNGIRESGIVIKEEER